MKAGILKRRAKNAGRPEWKVALAFHQWIRGFACIINNDECDGKIEAAHVDYAGDKGMGTKVSDRYAVPLCRFHHREQHGHEGKFSAHGGWPTFEKKYKINAIEISRKLWRLWPGRSAWEKKNGRI